MTVRAWGHETTFSAAQMGSIRVVYFDAGVGNDVIEVSDGLDIALLHDMVPACGRRLAVVQPVFVAGLGTPQHTNESPHGVVVHRCALARTPHKTQHRKPLQRIGVQQILRVTVRARRGEGFREPVVARNQACQQLAAGGQQAVLFARAAHKGRHGNCEFTQWGYRVGHGGLRGLVWRERGLRDARCVGG